MPDMNRELCQICQSRIAEPVQPVDIERGPQIRQMNGYASGQNFAKQSRWKSLFQSEGGKTVTAFVYGRMVLYIVEFAVAYVQFRIPDRTKYPPLPDLFLDNVQIVPWAGKVCEVIIMIYACALFTIIFSHKHRLVVIRRWAGIVATVYFSRFCTILMTGLPVPSTLKTCPKNDHGSFQQYIATMLDVSKSMGFQLNGQRTCGDYLFSGHTAALTLVMCFVREYTPRRWVLSHIVTWILTFVGMYSILASHGHYSIDVYIAFLLAYMTFQYYHTLAHVRNLSSTDRSRHFVIFPFFYYFENNAGRVANEYEWPLRMTSLRILTNNPLQTLIKRLLKKISGY